jgi:hypothetical protein
MHKLTISQGRFHAFTIILLSGLCLQLGSRRALAEDFCAVTLKVTGAKGEPIRSTWIELVDPSGRIVRREMMEGSEHKICDFGFGPHTLRVGTNECLPVAVSNLRLVLGYPITLNVTLNPCGYREQMRNACFVYFRTVDEDHSPIPGVSFSPRLNINIPNLTDGFGRWQGLFRAGHDLTFTKRGFAPTVTHIQCKETEWIDVEVVMKKSATPER